MLLAIMCLCAAAAAEGDGEVACLAELADPYGFRMGAPLSFNQMRDSAYLNFVSSVFNSVTMTNEMKAYSLLDQRQSKAAEDGMPFGDE